MKFLCGNTRVPRSNNLKLTSNLYNIASQGPSHRGGPHLECSLLSLGTEDEGRETHTSAGRIEPGMGERGLASDQGVELALPMSPCSSIDHQGGQELHIQSCFPKLLEKHA